MSRVRQWGIWLGALAIIAGGLTACGGQQANAPTPAATTQAPETPASVATAATGVATPASSLVKTTAVASPIGNATPVGGAASGQNAAARKATECAAFTAWLTDPEVKAALDKTAYWPDIVREGEKAAAGEPVDTATMQAHFAGMAKVAQTLRTSDVAGIDHATLQLAGRAMGLASRLAGGLAEGNLDAAGAGDAVAELQSAIAAYEADLAQRQADCG